jgi:hypothetical protein
MGGGVRVADGGELAGAVLFDGCSTIGRAEWMDGTGRVTEAWGGCCHSLQASMYDVHESCDGVLRRAVAGPCVLVGARNPVGARCWCSRAGADRAVVLATYAGELALAFSADDVEDNGTGTTTTARCDARRGANGGTAGHTRDRSPGCELWSYAGRGRGGQ